MEVTLGGERLGSGNKQKVHMRNYERSTHDKSFIWRSTMAAGTLVPFMTEVALPGDTFDINLNVDILTHPTIGPLFGSYKIQLDVFQIPIRLYQGKLHMNMLGIGMDMSAIKFPLVRLQANNLDADAPIDNQQVNPSSIFSYLGIRGLGTKGTGGTDQEVRRDFNAIPYLAYWDIYKNYYANKQEEIGAVIHKPLTTPQIIINFVNYVDITGTQNQAWADPLTTAITVNSNQDVQLILLSNNVTNDFDPNNIIITWERDGLINVNYGGELFEVWHVNEGTNIIAGKPTRFFEENYPFEITAIDTQISRPIDDTEPQISTFPLSNIDEMRQNILEAVASATAFQINGSSIAPYGLSLEEAAGTPINYSIKYAQEGLALKTYQSDLFNNWISTEWIDGPDGISEITKVDTSGGSFTIDELNMSKKVYDMLNRIALSGGSYDDWLDAVYTHERQRSAENPMYIGGMIRNLVFQEVVSNAATNDQPLGTLAGRGTLGQLHKGGHIIAKVDEPSYLMGIISLTPNIDYSQGNQWDVNLKTMNDLHKPALDAIGFQDLITDQFAFWETICDPATANTTFRSAGKQPAWINYMTNVNTVKGNFAEVYNQMYMVLNRRYTPKYEADGSVTVKDMTTYIDPTKFNHIFADTRRDAQNFWAQIGVKMIARRKMSAKVMPNL